MKYSDYRVLMEKEYQTNRKNIFTCYFFLVLSAVFFALFFLHVRELPVIGAAFLLDFAAGVYAFRAFKSLHPYWEMQLALKAEREPGEATVRRFTAGVEYALDNSLPAFHGRAPEIFSEALEKIEKSNKVSAEDMERLRRVLGRI